MPAPMGSNWYVQNAYAGSASGGPSAPAFGGGGSDMLTARDPLDAKRLAAGFAPGASYPDGYLGTMTERQEDKTLAVLQTRLTSTSYQRGVHVGDIISPNHYSWLPEFNPYSGLERQMTSQAEDVEGGIVMTAPRFAPTGDPVEMLAHDGKFASASPRERDAQLSRLGGDPAKNPVTVIDPSRAARLKSSLPRWSGGV
jgi:hypothetical protein